MNLLIKRVAATSFCCLLLATHGLLAQNHRKITISKNKITLKEALGDIEKQSGLTVDYNASQLNTSKQINLSIANQTLETTLDRILSGTGFTYKISSHEIMIVPIPKKGAKKIIKGKIIDNTKEPIIGAVIRIKGGTTGTITDVDGNFTIQAHDGETLALSCMGYAKQELVVSNINEPLTVTMSTNDNLLNTVVVTALGIKREEKALSYNVGKIDTEELTAVKDPNFVNSLNGKVAGLVVNSTGSVGGATKVVLRGAKSLSKDNNALYVIDGVPIINTRGEDTAKGDAAYAEPPVGGGEGISDLNPEDIENITVLTGPSAAALYGSYAANGAILITTKRGSTGKPRITVSYNSEFSKPFVLPKFQNTYGNKSGEFASWGNKMATPTDYNPENFYRTGFNSSVNGSISMGTDKNQTYASVGASNSSGIIPNNKYNRYNFTMRNTTKMFKDKLTLDLGAQLIIQNNQNILSQGTYFNPLTSIYLFPRGENFNDVRTFEHYNPNRSIMEQWWPYGDQGLTMQNPYWDVYRNLFNDKRDRYMLNASLKYQATSWLNFTGRIRVDNSLSEWQKRLYASTIGQLSDTQGYYGTSKTKEKQTYGDIMANIDKRWGDDFSLTANIGASYFDTGSDMVGVRGQLSQMPNFFAANNINMIGNHSGTMQNGWREQTQSVFASAELGYKGMLYLTVTGRNDWASALANTPNASFFYPSVGLSALISQMVKMPQWLTYMKVRGSYSSVGSAPQRFLTEPTYPYEQDNHGGLPNTISSGDIMTLKPENTKSYELGLDFRFLNNKLSLSGTFYKSDTYNQTFDIPRSASSGYPDLYIQSGDIGNWGIEASLGYKDTFGKVQWESELTFSMNRNKIKALAENYFDPLTQTSGSIDQLLLSNDGTYREMLKVGGSIGDMYTAGVLKKDANGNIYVNPKTGKFETENLTSDEFQKIGNSTPRCNLGFRNNFTYKDVHLGFIFTGRFGGEVVSKTQAILDSYGVSQASANARDNGGVFIGNQRFDPKEYYQYVGGTGALIDHYVYSATNIRLQELSIGYTLPKKWFGPVRATVSFIGRNLVMLYNKAPFDPESVPVVGNSFQGMDYFMPPSTRNLGFSVRLQF